MPVHCASPVNEDDDMEAVIGATGYVGSLLIGRLAHAGHGVRALAREPSRLDLPPGAERARVDLLRPRGLERALDGCATAYYLVHSMEPAPTADGDFATRDRRTAEAFVAAAARAGVERAVYLGGIAPREGRASPHVASRLEVERILLEGLPGSTALRASIVVGARSPSFRILVRLVERLAVLPLSGWGERRTRPIDERDVLDYLVRTPGTPGAAGRTLDVVGPDELSYGELFERVAQSMGVVRPRVGLPAGGRSVSAAIVAALSGQPPELVRPLMESLEHDLLPRDDRARGLYGLRPRPFDRAVEHALREWERREQLAAR